MRIPRPSGIGLPARSGLQCTTLRLAAAVLSICLTLATAGCKKGVTVHGQVTDVVSGKPLPGAGVSVSFYQLDSNMNWVDGGVADLVSGPDGGFSTASPDMRARFQIEARKDGYYPNRDCRPLREMERKTLGFIYTVKVQLYPVVKPQALPRGSDGGLRVSPPRRHMGWNFRLARMVDESQADIICGLDEAGKDVAWLEARGAGGFVREVWVNGPWVLYNMHEAPESGYEQRVDLRALGLGESACFYVRTADGRHYAKIDVTGRTRSSAYKGLQFNWVYQPNGSTWLEIPYDETKLLVNE